MKYREIYLAVALTLLSCMTGGGVEIHSSGNGGGPWSDPATWHGGRVPASGDTVVIAMRDTVIFDRDDGGKATCRGLDIDPEGVLTFKTGPGRRSMTIDGSIESYGVIKIDGTDRSTDYLSLSVISSKDRPGEILLRENSSLLVYGRKGMPDHGRNVWLASVTGDKAKRASIVADEPSMIDLHNIGVTGMVVTAKSIDNTGNKSNERLNIIGNRFVAGAHIVLTACDTPVIRKNRFECVVKGTIEAIRMTHCKLAELSGNSFRGGHRTAIKVSYDTDSSAADNSIEDCTEQGMYWHGKNAMVKRNRISRSARGMKVYLTTGVLEDVVVSESKIGFELIDLTMQLTNCRVEDQPKDGIPLILNKASVILLNCNIADDQIRCERKPPAGVFAQAMQYLVVKVNGDLPRGASVELRTAKVSGGVPKGKADLNVRNSPAPIGRDGFTPFPITMKPLIVRSWRLGAKKKLTAAPFCDLIITSPQQGKPAKVLKTQLVEPDDSWFREEPNAGVATLEVNIP